jgi:ATP-dependent Clp protease ATP-binding subunit ClpA
MFERYREKTRRVIFFARYEASQLGSRSIETQHLLLGLLREAPEVVAVFLGPGDSVESVAGDVRQRVKTKERISTAIDLPLSPECKRILVHTAEEAELLGHRDCDPIHLLLGVLREGECLAASILTGHGLDPAVVRERLARGFVEPGAPIPDPASAESPDAGNRDYVPDAATAIRIAEAVWSAMGFEDLEPHKPFEAELNHPDFWSVSGAADPGSGLRLVAVLAKRDGRVLRAEGTRD